MQKVAKPVRIPLFPTREQRERLEFFFACWRFVYNHCRHDRNIKSMADASTVARSMKKGMQYKWLAEAPAHLLELAAYYRIYADKKHPLSKKADYQFFRDYTSRETIVDYEKQTIHIPKVGKITAKVLKNTPLIDHYYTVERRRNRYFAVVQIEVERVNPPKVAALYLQDGKIYLSDGNTMPFPQENAELRRRVETLKAHLKECQPNSKGFNRLSSRIKTLETRLAHRRELEYRSLAADLGAAFCRVYINHIPKHQRDFCCFKKILKQFVGVLKTCPPLPNLREDPSAAAKYLLIYGNQHL